MKYKIKDKRNHKSKIKNKMFNNKNRNNFNKSQLFYLSNDFISIFIIYTILFIIN
jgi:hypothetical protein